MPTYEYECETCGKRFEKFQNMTDDPLEKCPKCGCRVHRLITAGGAVIVKGNASRAPRCGLDRPCCGRDVPCDSPPCDD